MFILLVSQGINKEDAAKEGTDKEKMVQKKMEDAKEDLNEKKEDSEEKKENEEKLEGGEIKNSTDKKEEELKITETNEDAKMTEEKQETAKTEEEKIDTSKKEEAKTNLFGDKPFFEDLGEDEYEDNIEEPKDGIKFELAELWKCYKSKDIHNIKRTLSVLRAELVPEFQMREPLIKEFDMDLIEFKLGPDIQQVYKSRVLKDNIISHYDGDELDYFLIYDMISDILTRYSRVGYNAMKQIQHLEVPEDIKERIMFDVLLSEYFQLPDSTVIQLYYKNVAAKMRRRLPHEAFNLMIKRMPRMDPEIKERWLSFYSFLMSHTGHRIDSNVLKRFTDKESLHYK